MAHITINSPLGPLCLFEESGAIVALEWGRAAGGEEVPALKNPALIQLLIDARGQLEAYFDGSLKKFDLPVRPPGTPFQKSVWALMARIPYGAVRSYGDLAGDLGSGPRAIGGACGRNPVPIIIPCHRVVGKGGRLGGYTGAHGTETKDALLRLEGAVA